MSEQRHRLMAYRPSGELMDRLRGAEAEMRETAERMAKVRGQKLWKYDLYEEATIKATYKRGTWTEHGKEKA